MSSKGKRRRESRRRARQRREGQPAERPLEGEGVAAEAGGPVNEESPGREEETVPSAAEARHSRAARKRAKRGDAGPWERVRSLRVPPWLIVTPVLVIGVGVLAYLVLSSGSSGVTGGSSATPTPDPRVQGTPDVTINIEAGGAANDAFFRPNTIEANAGDLVELVVTNIGSVSHNLRVSGLDKEYDTRDDFEMPPNVILPGETQRLLVKIDPPPDTYPFRCDFHPLVQTGTLTLE